MKTPARARTLRRSFSLFELLLVVALMAALISILLGVYSSILQSSALTAGADSLNEVLIEAHGDAMARNLEVEVRLYDLPGAISSTLAYRAAQLHWMNADGTRPAIDSIIFLPATVVIDASAEYSSLIASDPIASTPDTTDPHMNSQTRVFHFLSDGSTDLTPGSIWFLTLRAAAQANAAQLPGDWASVTIDPITGKTQIFRP